MLGERLREYLGDLAGQLSEGRQVWAVLGLAGAILLVAVWLHGAGRPAPVVLRAKAPQRAPAVRAASTPATIAVDVAGAVARPGVVYLAKGARVDDALRLAGGPLTSAAVEAVNRALLLRDGQQVFVPKRGSPQSASAQAPASAAPGAAQASAPAGAAQGGSSGKVELNGATLEQLDSLPGIGPVMAKRICDYRQEHGRFTRVEDLQQIDGIGPKKFSQLKDRVWCSP